MSFPFLSCTDAWKNSAESPYATLASFMASSQSGSIPISLHRKFVVVQGKGFPLHPLLFGEPVVDLPDRRVERIRVLARSTNMGVSLLRVYPLDGMGTCLTMMKQKRGGVYSIEMKRANLPVRRGLCPPQSQCRRRRQSLDRKIHFQRGHQTG